MRKVIGIGETILDIVFKKEQPVAAVPGGSSFNAIISLGRAGVPTTFISETGDDRVGHSIIGFMEENGVSSQYMTVRAGSKSPISLAFLNEQNDAEYIFYKEHEKDRPSFDFPHVEADDIVVFGSFYAINPAIRKKVGSFLRYAREQRAILYYDVNFRSPHKAQLKKLMPTIMENFMMSTIVRGSAEDFENIFGLSDADELYSNKINYFCTNFICTNGDGDVEVRTTNGGYHFPVQKVKTVSTIGAGDNFNAGVVYGIIKHHVSRQDIETLGVEGWEKLMSCGMQFASNVCASVNNSIDSDFGMMMKRDLPK